MTPIGLGRCGQFDDRRIPSFRIDALARPRQRRATATGLVAGDLLVSNGFAQVLRDAALAISNLSGVDVRDALMEAYDSPVPTPGALSLLALAGAASGRRRR